MSEVQLYTKTYCGYSKRAKALLAARGIPYDDVDVTSEGHEFEEMSDRSGGETTVPQVFISGRHVGGYTELKALDDQGELEPLRAASGSEAAH